MLQIAKWDEYSDEIWYDKWEEIFKSYKNAETFNKKLDILTNAISETNLEYYKRNKIEVEKRLYYKNLLNE
jgi:hypothetical protein